MLNILRVPPKKNREMFSTNFQTESNVAKIELNLANRNPQIIVKASNLVTWNCQT